MAKTQFLGVIQKYFKEKEKGGYFYLSSFSIKCLLILTCRSNSVKTNSKSIVFGAVKNPVPNEVKWFVLQ